MTTRARPSPVRPPSKETSTFTVQGTNGDGHGSAPYTWSLVSGKLPHGLPLVSPSAPSDNDNELAGTPTKPGTFAFTMKVTDSLGDIASGQVTMTVDR